MNKYNPKIDFVQENQNNQGIDFTLPIEDQDYIQYPYVCIDQLRNATINDDRIYILTHDSQHDLIKNGQVLPEQGKNALSGYFTSEATALNRINEDGKTFDSYGLSRDTCVKPFSKTGKAEDAIDKGHLDGFTIDRDRLEEIYGTRDFNAAIGKCSANNQFGSDGGDQGYNSCLNELYNNGCLKYADTYDAVPESMIKCRNEFDKMNEYVENKSSLIIEQHYNLKPEKNYDELIKNKGYKLDSRCYEKTNFNSIPRNDLNNDYKDYTAPENVNIETKLEDRIYNPNKESEIKNQNLSEIKESIDGLTPKPCDSYQYGEILPLDQLDSKNVKPSNLSNDGNAHLLKDIKVEQNGLKAG